MTPVRRTPLHINLPFLHGDLGAGRSAAPGDMADSSRSMALRALLLLSGAVGPGDLALARLSDDDLSMLRVSLASLAADEPTSAA